MHSYGEDFYRDVRDAVRRSAAAMVPFVIHLLRPKSAIDVGCGDGSWLAEFAKHGVEVLGVEGEHDQNVTLAIPRHCFAVHDLCRPFEPERRYDLALCLEVGEHLRASCADVLVQTLSSCAPFVLFSAAIPGQGGTGHVNEQWPEYWSSRFASRGYEVADIIRPRFWRHGDVAAWYAQNALLYFEPAAVTDEMAQRGLTSTGYPPLQLVHPATYERVRWDARRLELSLEIAEVVPPGATFGFIDDDRIQVVTTDRRRVVAFPDDIPGRPPVDWDALPALERLRADGATHLVVPWTAEWWPASYGSLGRTLTQHGDCVWESENGRIYDLSRWEDAS